MKRLVCSVSAIALCILSASADENVRAVQAKLKDGGYYFGEVNGERSGDLSAAITRYQIRNGLQITGKLDAETSKALGVKQDAASTTSSAASSETWRTLRKNDKRAPASSDTAQRKSSVAPRRENVPNESPMHALEPVTEDGSKVVLSPARLRDYVAAFVLAGLDPQVGAELEFFGDRVHYYNDGFVGREKIRGDLQRYAAHWPQRRFWLAGEVQVEPQPESRLRVTFPLRYDLQNGAKHKTGKVKKTLLLEVVGEDLQIVGVDERKST
ncbi:MAG: peptidoglycan-binding domain-containing protein [Chthoniobacterales bacterium]